MTNSINQIEKNIETSFGYVKKDLLALNDMVSELNEKIQHLSMNQAILVEKVIKKEKAKKRKEDAKKNTVVVEIEVERTEEEQKVYESLVKPNMIKAN